MARQNKIGDAHAASPTRAGARPAPDPRGEDKVPENGVGDLDRLDADLLRRRWRSILGRAAPPRLSRQLMIRILFWREQIARSGDLDSSTKARLDAAIGRVGQDIAGVASTVSKPKPLPLRAGVMLMREHGGVQHRVMVLARGFAWNGKTFGSLSAVARAITGTSWNGRRFFGIDKRESGDRDKAAAKDAIGPGVSRSEVAVFDRRAVSLPLAASAALLDRGAP